MNLLDRNPDLRHAAAIAGGATAVIIAIGLAIFLVNYISYARQISAHDNAGAIGPAGGAKIYDRHGNLIYEYVDDHAGVRVPVRLDQVNPTLLAATISTEDPSFFDNPGVNFRGLARATLENLNPFGGVFQGSGGSSLTQQLVKNVYVPTDERGDRSVDRKAREIVYALELTKRYTKEQILEWYLNRINYGGLSTGIEAASQSYFGKSSKDLTLAEASLLAGIPQAPANYNPRIDMDAALERRNQILDLMAAHSPIQIAENTYYTPTAEEIAAAKQTPVKILPPRENFEAPHFVLSVVGPELEQIVGRDMLQLGGLNVTTTLDIGIQRQAQTTLERSIQSFEQSSNTHNGAVLVIQPKTGEVIAMIGSRDYFREDIDGAVNNLLAPNSPGSTFKPFVYLSAFLNLGWNPGTIIQDTPVTVKQPDGRDFSPTNPNRGYSGNVTLRNALGNSLNVPAFKTAQQLGVDKIVQFAKSVGFTGFEGSYGPSIAIGGVDLRPIDLAYGYSAIANGGLLAGQNTFAPEKSDESQIRPISILKVTDANGRVLYDVNEHRAERQVIPAEHAFMISDILSDPNAECQTFGCGGLSVPGYKVAVKTGTSEPYDPAGPNKGKIGETWAFGYTPDVVVAVWAGNADNSPLVNILSTSISYRAMRDILLAAYKGQQQTPFVRPAGVVTRRVCTPAPAATPGAQPTQQQPTPQNQDPNAQPTPSQICTEELSTR